MATPKRLDFDRKTLEMKRRLENCWALDIDWTLHPNYFTEVMICKKILIITFS
jgi:hypothetical protein